MVNSSWWTVIGALIFFVTSSILLVEEWKEHPKKRPRHTALAALGLLTLLAGWRAAKNVSDESKDGTDRLTRCNEQIAGLKQEVETGQEDSRRESEANRQQLIKFTDQIANMKASAMSESLREKLTEVQKQLTIATAPKPQPLLIGGFAPPLLDGGGLPKEVHVTKTNGAASFQVSVCNLSDVTAQGLVMSVRIPHGCKYAREPPGSKHVAGAVADDREFDFTLPLPGQACVEAQTIDVIVPDTPNGRAELSIGVRAWCTNCGPTQNPALSVFVDG